MNAIRLYGGDLGDTEEILVRCNLAEASAPIEVDWCMGEGKGWEPTQYQSADANCSPVGLQRIAKEIAADGVQMPTDEFSCESEEIDT